MTRISVFCWKRKRGERKREKDGRKLSPLLLEFYICESKKQNKDGGKGFLVLVYDLSVFVDRSSYSLFSQQITIGPTSSQHSTNNFANQAQIMSSFFTKTHEKKDIWY